MRDEDLEYFRQQIDFYDGQILSLLAQRFKVVKQIGEVKKDDSLPAVDKKRWDTLLAKLQKEGAEKYGIPAQFTASLWNTIHKEAVRIESEA